MAYIFGQMEKCMMVNGSTDNNMVKQSIQIQKVNQEKVLGNMDKELTGLEK